MKIFVLHLGGTIACTEENGVLAPNADIIPYFKDMARHFKGISFAHKSLLPFLSEHLDGILITRAVREAVKAAKSGKYGGIIVTHGSDTIAYTASAIAYALGNDCIPTVAVCADLPLSDKSSSGHINLSAATALIASGQARGVFSVYKSKDNEAAVFRATRLLRHRAYESELSTAREEYGKVSFIAPATAVFIKNQAFTERADEMPPLSFKLKKSCPVSVMQVYPSMVCTRPARSCRAVILSTYHSGTLDTENQSIKKFCAVCKRRNIPVFADGIGASSDYKSMEAFPRLGIRRLPKSTSPVAMFMKLWILLSLDADADSIELSLGGDI